MNCPACNKPIADGASFCAACGARVSTPAAMPAPSPAPIANATTGFAPAAAAGAAAWDGMKKDFPGLVQRAKNIILQPNTEWPVIAVEITSTGKLYTGYVMPLAAIGPIASIIGMSLVGISVPLLGTIRTPILSSVIYAIVAFVLALVGVFILSLIINALAPTFAGEKNQAQALKVAAYAYTPAWLAGIFSLLPMLSVLGLIAALYSLYLLYLGLPVLMRAPKDKAVGYTAVVVLCAIVLGIIISAIGGVVVGAGGLATMGIRGNAMQQQAASEKTGAAAAGALVGSLLGSDDKGKAAIGTAIGNLAEVGRQMEQQAAQTKAGVAPDNSTTPGAPPAAADLVAATGAMTALGSALSGGKSVDPVDFRTLKAMLPESLPSMPRTNSSGERTETMGVQVATAEAEYQDTANGRVHVKISDLGTLTSLAGMAAALEPKIDKETDTGYEKTTRTDGRQIHETYDRRSQNGEMKVLVGGRFEVDVTGSGVKMETIKAALATIDLNRLDSMKSQGVKAQ
jgi:Yip1 domain